MAFLGDVGKIFLGGASTGDVVGAATTYITKNPYVGGVVGEIAQTAADDLGNKGNKGETTTTQTVQSANAGPSYGPAQNVEIAFTGQPDMGGVMPANFQVPMFPQNQFMQNPYQQANILKFAPAVGGAAAGFVADFVIDLFTGEPKKMIITRKLRRDTEKLMELYNNNMDAVAAQLSQLKGKQYDSGHVLKILMHKFSNQGPYVTKAAVRKTRKTVRKLDSLQRLYADVCKAKPARRAPARRRTSAMAKASC